MGACLVRRASLGVAMVARFLLWYVFLPMTLGRGVRVE
jgi:hypothetical protein